MQILLADDHPLFRAGVKPVLEKLALEALIVEAEDYPSAFDAASRHADLDLALLDLNMPGMTGLNGIHHFRTTFPQIPLVVLSAIDDQDPIQALLAQGVLGFINKSSPSEVILSALQLVLAGGIYIPPNLLPKAAAGHAVQHQVGSQETLTQRQIDVLCELASGQTNKQIARSLKVSEGTIKIHLTSIFRILKVTNRTEALLAAQKMGLCDGK